MKWGAGAPCVDKLPKEEIEWLIHPNTLLIHAHMSLGQRAEALNNQFDREISAKDVREIFRGMGVTKQKFKSKVGPPTPTTKSMEKQQQYIDIAKAEYKRLTDEGYEIFQCDASIFSADSFTPSAWALKGEPPMIPHKWTNK